MTDRNDRDNDRRQVYAAEDLSAELTILVERRSIPGLQSVADDLGASAWWRRNFNPAPVQVRSNRSQQRSYFDPVSRRICLSPVAQDLNTLLHEITHVACLDRSVVGPVHGPTFRGLHLQVRQAVTGRRSAIDLRQVYEQFGLAVDPLSGLEQPQQPSLLGDHLYEETRVVGRPGVNGNRRAHRGAIAL